MVATSGRARDNARDKRWTSTGDGVGVLVALAAFLASAGPARAADTIEVWEEGYADLEAYAGWDGIGRKRSERLLSGDFIIGYGLAPRISLYAGTALESAEDLSERGAALYAGGFAALLDTDHLDIDFLLDFTAGGQALQDLQFLPMIELNLDLLAEREAAGVYTRLSLPMGTAERATGKDPFLRPGGFLAAADPSSGVAPTTTSRTRWTAPLLPTLPSFPSDERLGNLCRCNGQSLPGVSAALATTVGGYLTLFSRHQFLVELDVSTTLLAPQPARPIDLGGLAFGYNFLIAEGLESINEVYLDLPQDGERPAITVVTGFILGVPTPLL